MVGNQWQFVYDEADGRTCPDGTRAPQTTIYRFDPYAWVGTMKVLHGDECGDQPAMVDRAAHDGVQADRWRSPSPNTR